MSIRDQAKAAAESVDGVAHADFDAAGKLHVYEEIFSPDVNKGVKEAVAKVAHDIPFVYEQAGVGRSPSPEPKSALGKAVKTAAEAVEGVAGAVLVMGKLYVYLETDSVETHRRVHDAVGRVTNQVPLQFVPTGPLAPDPEAQLARAAEEVRGADGVLGAEVVPEGDDSRLAIIMAQDDEAARSHAMTRVWGVAPRASATFQFPDPTTRPELLSWLREALGARPGVAACVALATGMLEVTLADAAAKIGVLHVANLLAPNLPVLFRGPGSTAPIIPLPVIPPGAPGAEQKCEPVSDVVQDLEEARRLGHVFHDMLTGYYCTMQARIRPHPCQWFGIVGNPIPEFCDGALSMLPTLYREDGTPVWENVQAFTQYLLVNVPDMDDATIWAEVARIAMVWGRGNSGVVVPDVMYMKKPKDRSHDGSAAGGFGGGFGGGFNMNPYETQDKNEGWFFEFKPNSDDGRSDGFEKVMALSLLCAKLGINDYVKPGSLELWGPPYYLEVHHIVTPVSETTTSYHFEWLGPGLVVYDICRTTKRKVPVPVPVVKPSEEAERKKIDKALELAAEVAAAAILAAAVIALVQLAIEAAAAAVALLLLVTVGSWIFLD
jgi:hypothetical protein